MLESLTISAPELPQDFCLAKHHRVESRGHAEKMPDSVRTHPPIEPAIELRTWDLVKGGKKLFHRLSRGGTCFSGNSVQFAAIACRENHGFFQDAALAQFIGGIEGLLRRKDHSLPQFERRGAMVASNQCHMNPHCALSCRTGLRLHQKKR